MLPQPLEQLLKTLPLVNVLEVKDIMEFLASFLKVQRLSDWQVFEAIYQFCLGPLTERLVTETVQM